MNGLEVFLLLLILGVNIATMIVLIRRSTDEPVINVTQKEVVLPEGHKGWAHLKG